MTNGEGSLASAARPRTVLAPAGELDVASAVTTHKRMIELPLKPRAELVLDLRAVTFLDSTGIRLILQAHEHALRHWATFLVVRGPHPVMRVLELIGLEEQLEIADEP